MSADLDAIEAREKAASPGPCALSAGSPKAEELVLLIQEENKQLAAQLDEVREILDGADTAEGPLAERYAKRLTRIGKAIRRWNAPAEVEVKS